MANLPETPDYPAGVYQIETSDPVLGGPGGIANRQAEQLGNRTAWLKDKVDAFISGTVAVFKATKLATARTLSISGAGSGSASFDGSANANIALTLADSGAVAGTYPKVTVNTKGLVTGGQALGAADIPVLDWSKIGTGKPTTLAGYGIPVPSQAEAEGGAENSKPMTALRVAQAIAQKVIQATEAVLGVAKIATQAQTDAGADDTSIVTPKKLRWGFAFSWGTNGFMALPTWLGAFIFQWGRLVTGTGSSSYNLDTIFPIPFPNSVFGVAVSSGVQIADLDANANYRACGETLQLGVPTLMGFDAQLTLTDPYVSHSRSLRYITLGR